MMHRRMEGVSQGDLPLVLKRCFSETDYGTVFIIPALTKGGFG